MYRLYKAYRSEMNETLIYSSDANDVEWLWV